MASETVGLVSTSHGITSVWTAKHLSMSVPYAVNPVTLSDKIVFVRSLEIYTSKSRGMYVFTNPTTLRLGVAGLPNITGLWKRSLVAIFYLVKTFTTRMV